MEIGCDKAPDSLPQQYRLVVTAENPRLPAEYGTASPPVLAQSALWEVSQYQARSERARVS